MLSRRSIAQRLIQKHSGIVMGLDENADFLKVYENIKKVEKNDIQTFKSELEQQFLERELCILREKRDVLLEKTDRYATIDYPHATEEAKQAWLDYRQALRDLPANTVDPENPVWPEAPTP